MHAPASTTLGEAAAVLITGPLGSGKTSVAVELGLQLEQRGVPNAVIDLDWLCWVGPGIGGQRLRALLTDNLRSVVVRFGAEGVNRFVLARTMGDARDVAGVRDALGGAALTVVRLEVPATVAAARVLARGGGGGIAAVELAIQTELWSASSVLDADLVVPNEDRPVMDAAAQILAYLVAAQQRQWAMPSSE
jgi:hypothetical protein